jgi:hypothetical protein
MAPVGKNCVWEKDREATGGKGVNKGFFHNDGFEVIIWILVIIFLLSIFFDEGIE